MGTLWLHMGHPKTGTSALQVFFARNRAVFTRQNSGYFWGAGAIDGKTTAGNAAWLIRDDDRFRRRMKVLANHLSTGRGSVLSSEFLANMDSALLKKLQEISDDVRALVYLREPADMVISHYYNGVDRNGGRPMSLAKYAAHYIRRPFARHGTWLDWLSSELGQGKLVVRSYAQARAALTQDAVKSMGFEPAAFDHDLPRINASSRLPPIDPQIVSMLREVSRLEIERAARTWFPGQALTDVYDFPDFPRP